MSWIRIVRWDEFQHYADRDPIWIKDYVRQLRDDRYLDLTLAERGLLKDLRLLYAGSRAAVRWDTSRIRAALQVRTTHSQLLSLVNAGFIEITDSKPLALARAGEEKEKETPKSPSKKPRARVTGWRLVRGSHGQTHVPDPNGTDRPPPEVRT